MQSPVIAIIGAGHMGSSLITALVQNGHPADKIWATCPDQTKLNQLHHFFPIHTTTDNNLAVKQADILILAVKPQILQQVALEIASQVEMRKPLIISIATGIRLASLQAWLGATIAIVRAMPNMPAMIGAGATAMYANSIVNPEQLNLAETILRSVGVVVWLPKESLIDAVTAISGSGPAYFFLLMEILLQTAIDLGLAKDTALLLIKETALGASRLAMESDHSFQELRQQVTSPGGTTEKAISVLEEHHMQDIFKQAIIAAAKHAEELARR